MFGVRSGKVSLPADRFVAEAAASPTEREKAIPLNSDEEMYAEIRDRNFNAVGPYLARKAKALSEQDEKRRAAKTVQELRVAIQ